MDRWRRPAADTNRFAIPDHNAETRAGMTAKRRNPSLDSADIQDRDGASVVLETISQVPAVAQTSLRQWRL